MSIPANIRPDQIPAAIADAVHALSGDRENPEIPADVLAERELALKAAIEFCQIQSVTGAAANLRVFWSV